MALSEHEQRMFDEMERDLLGSIKQPKATPGATRWFVGGIFLLVGLAAMIFAVAATAVLVGAIGFAVMLFALVWASSAKPASMPKASSSRKPKPAGNRGSFFEDRWNNRG